MISSTNLNFSQACEYLSLSPTDFTTLREQGFVAIQNEAGRQVYSKLGLDLTHILLRLEIERGWSRATIAWYADLVFATEVGRSILLPIPDGYSSSTILPKNWLETAYVNIVLDDLSTDIEGEDGSLVALLRSLVLVGEGQFWSDLAALQTTALFPIVNYFEQRGIKIIDQRQAVARDAGSLVLGLMLVFNVVAPPISIELSHLLGHIRERLAPQVEIGSQRSDHSKIRKERLIAVDKLYAAKSVEIHTPPDAWDFRLGILSAKKESITLQMKVPLDATVEVIDNVIDLIRPYVGNFGARVVHLLYEIANDAPFWRNPTITVNTNELLDRLGMKRTSDGSHETRNRTRLRDVLNIAHDLEIVGEYSTWESGEVVRKGFYKKVLSLIGATFESREHEGISTAELRLKGLPKSMQIRLNFYDGVRRPDGKLGNQYVLMPPLSSPEMLPKANHAGTYELLKAYLLFRYRQTRMSNRTLTMTRATALEKASITNKNASRATMTLRKALDKLVQEGTLESYSEKLPTQPNGSLDVVLSKDVIYDPEP